MPKFLTRIVALLLIPCLMADAATSAMVWPQKPRSKGTDLPFMLQAVSPPVEVGAEHPLENPLIKAAASIAAEAHLGIPTAPLAWDAVSAEAERLDVCSATPFSNFDSSHLFDFLRDKLLLLINCREN